MDFAEIVRLYTGKDAGKVSDKELEQVEAKLKASRSCPECGFCYQYNTDISELGGLSLEGYNTVVVQVFCKDRYTVDGNGFKCGFERKTDTSFALDKCPECGNGLVFTVVAMNVDASGLVESFCPKCGSRIASGRPFARV